MSAKCHKRPLPPFHLRSGVQRGVVVAWHSAPCRGFHYRELLAQSRLVRQGGVARRVWHSRALAFCHPADRAMDCECGWSSTLSSGRGPSC